MIDSYGWRAAVADAGGEGSVMLRADGGDSAQTCFSKEFKMLLTLDSV